MKRKREERNSGSRKTREERNKGERMKTNDSSTSQ